MINRKGRRECSGHTDIGRVRLENQDCYAVNPDHDVYIVADGMGGHDDGAVASKLAVSLAEAEIIRLLEKHKSALSDARMPERLFARAFENVNRHIHRKNNGKTGQSVMGTTLSAVALVDYDLLFSNVGDSRIYLFDIDTGTLKQISRDDTVAEDMASKGISTFELRESYYQNSLTQAIGTRTYVTPNTGSISTNSQDIIMICSDGLYHMIEDSELEHIIRNSDAKKAGMNELVNTLIDTANAYGGQDNITVIAIRV